MTVTAQTRIREEYRRARPVVSFAIARQLAVEFDRPLLAVSRRAVRRSYQALHEALPHVELYYAVKANPDPLILETLREAGASADVCTYREMEQALSAGFLPDRMIHTHPCKTSRDLEDCRRAGLSWFTFDNRWELAKLDSAAPDANLLLRLAAPARSSKIDLSSKFGAAPDEALELLAEAGRLGLRVAGLSFHVGSQCVSPDDFGPALQAARHIWDAAAQFGAPLDVLDIGGGFPAPYREAVMTMETYCRTLAGELDRAFGDTPARIIAEPGRCLCADAVTLVAKVIGKSIRGGVPWYYLNDGIYGSFSGMCYDHAEFPLLVETRGRRRRSRCVVAGPTCDSGDVIARDQELPELEVGELVLVPSMGAYTSASATDFNGLPRAVSVAVD